MRTEPNAGPAWGQRRTAPKLPFVDLLSPQPGERLKVLALSESVEACPTHYMGGRTVPCLGSPDTCFGCSAGQGTRWKGYLAGLLFGMTKVVLVELTEAAMEAHEERWRGEGLGLRGYGLTLMRRGKSRQGKVIVEFSDKRVAEESLPKPPDVRSLMTRIWGNDGRMAEKRLKDLEVWPPQP